MQEASLLEYRYFGGVYIDDVVVVGTSWLEDGWDKHGQHAASMNLK
jgi:hypothetical protein